METLGLRIARYRVQKGLNQSELARALTPPLTPQAVQAWEKGGGIQPSKFENIATVLGVTLAQLLMGDDYAGPSQPARLVPGNVRDAVMVLRKAYARVGWVYDIEKEPEQFCDAYEAITAQEGGATTENLIDLSDVFAEKLANRAEKTSGKRANRGTGSEDRGADEGATPERRAASKAR